ncbi:hypothetical protein DEO72_LG11g995 [Vigna unguiculata]|uniref:Uncharacterized protein n=1 Tax=Vigna unguiculata TaxID=3917 RepID=A0A4D6NQA9_VIGUN|nr:hypothetical protein DEO72_LG11g995 [Vigna unguiculata]
MELLNVTVSSCPLFLSLETLATSSSLHRKIEKYENKDGANLRVRVCNLPSSFSCSARWCRFECCFGNGIVHVLPILRVVA